MKKKTNKMFNMVMALALVCAMAVNPMSVLAAEAEEVAVEVTETATPVILAAEDAVEIAVVEPVVEVEENAVPLTEPVVEVVVPGEEADSTLSVDPRAHVTYYPTAGANSGYFYNIQSSQAVYNLPAGTMQISYSISGAGTCYLRFYSGAVMVASSGALNGNSTGNSSVVLPYSGSYIVFVEYPNGNSSTEVIYAYSLYRK